MFLLTRTTTSMRSGFLMDFACRTGDATRELQSTALETCTMYLKVSLISSCSRLCEILFHLLFCDHALIANAGGCQTFVSKGGMLHRGDGWLVPLKLCFEGHSPSVAATEWTSNNFTWVALTFRYTQLQKMLVPHMVLC